MQILRYMLSVILCSVPGELVLWLGGDQKYVQLVAETLDW